MIVNNFWEGKKVLVTGHTGFKGGWLSIWLKILGAKVSGYSLNPSGNNNLFTSTKISKIFNYDFRGDINNITRLRNCIKISKPQIIFHLAAQPSVAESFKEPLNTTITNVVGTVNLLEIIRKNKFIKSAVIITTDKVYKVPKLYNSKLKFKEDASLGGEDLYSASKASAELIVHSYLKSFFAKLNCNIATARAGNCIGGGDWKKDRIIKDCMESFVKNKKLIIRKPKATRPWQHVLEPLFGYLVLAEKLFSKKGKNFETIKKYQEKINALLGDKQKIKADGLYGKGTEAAIQSIASKFSSLIPDLKGLDGKAMSPAFIKFLDKYEENKDKVAELFK
jgi:CDP-glucose 4,6-dehydratase